MAWGDLDGGWGLAPWGLAAEPAAGTVANLAREYVVPTWYPGGFVDQLIRKIRFERIEQPSETVRWNRASPLPTVSRFDEGASLPASAMDTSRVTVTMRRLGDVAEVDTFQDSAASDPNPQLAVQVQAKRVAIVRALGALLVSGSAAVFDSLDARIAAGQRVSLATPTKDDVRRLIHRVTASDASVGGGADCLVGNERVVRYCVRLYEEAGGGGLTYAFDSDLGVSIPHVHGVPILVGQVPVLAGTPPRSFLYALKVTGPAGIRILHARGRSTDFGIEVSPLPMQATIAKRGAFVGGFYSLLIPEDESIARIEDIDMDSLPVPLP